VREVDAPPPFGGRAAAERVGEDRVAARQLLVAATNSVPASALMM
jgi:hypothetical protein